MTWKTIKDLSINGKTILVRVDINVPFANGQITDATRIERIKPTIDYILSQDAKPVLLAHFGRPKGQVVPEMSLAPVAEQMGDFLGYDVVFCSESIGDPAKAAIDSLAQGKVLLLENTRFHAGEEKNDAELARAFAELGDVYCNDAFSAAHRAHASTEALAKLLPNCAGLLMAAELSALEAALSTPKRPVVAIVGGAKISTKLDLLSNLIEKTDHLIIGGGMANTFLAAQGKPVGKSLCEHDLLDTAREILAKGQKNQCNIYLPADIIVAKEFKAGAENETYSSDNCPEDGMILDAGPRAISDIKAIFDQSKTLVWNGPLGAFEIPPFDTATNACAAHAAALTENGKLISIAGGGDTVSALNSSSSADKFSYISTAGGAFLEWMEGKELPGVKALN